MCHENEAGRDTEVTVGAFGRLVIYRIDEAGGYVDQPYEVYRPGETVALARGRTNWAHDLPPGTYDLRLLPWRDADGLFAAKEERRDGLVLTAGQTTEITLMPLQVVADAP